MGRLGNIYLRADGKFNIVTLDTLPSYLWPSSSVRLGTLGKDGGAGTMMFRCTAEECAKWTLMQEFDREASDC
jgi:hypothetical protein